MTTQLVITIACAAFGLGFIVASVLFIGFCFIVVRDKGEDDNGPGLPARLRGYYKR